MVTTPKGEFLVIVFRPELTLALSEAQPAEGVSIEGVSYRATSTGDFTGFYDWLRDRSGKIIGLRYWPGSEGKLPLHTLNHLPYVRVPPGGTCIEVYFSQKRETDESRSDDQAFGGNSHFLSDSGELAICFETYFLSDSEMTSIREAKARWASLRTDPVERSR